MNRTRVRPLPLVVALRSAFAASTLLALDISAQQHVISLADLNGQNGFRLDGEAPFDFSGLSVAGAGDINGDGMDDIILSAMGADPNGAYSGSSYVVLGRNATAFAAVINLSSLDGSNGFRLDGIPGDYCRIVSGAGDVNGDGLGDLLIGAYAADPNGNDSGSVYVVFGQSGSAFPASRDLSSLDGSNGFRLDGVGAGDSTGLGVADAGDVNGDGLDDIIVGAFGASPNGAASGASFVVFGHIGAAAAALIDLSALNGSNGFRLEGVAAGDYSGFAVDAAGDINGDGVDDLIIGALTADQSASGSGSSYVVYGRSDAAFPATFNLSTLDGSNGFRLDGEAMNDISGYAVSAAGDINGDGHDDLLIGARRSNVHGTDSGSVYVVFGRTGSIFPATIGLGTLDGSNGFRLDGVGDYHYTGRAVAAAGDFNGDGLDDLIIGADGADPNGPNSGSSYIAFGQSNLAFPATLRLGSLTETQGLQLDGASANHYSGWDVAGAGDFNGDGLDDIIIGAPDAGPDGTMSGSSYVVFGALNTTLFRDDFE